MGPLLADTNKLLDYHADLAYQIISPCLGDEMADGFFSAR